MTDTENTDKVEKSAQGSGIRTRRLGETLPVLYLETLVLTIVGQNLGGILVVIAGMCLGCLAEQRYDVWFTASMYAVFIGIWMVTLLFIGLSAKRKPILQAVGRKSAGNNWKNLLLGFVLGFGMNGLCILAAYLHKDIVIQFAGVRPVSLVLIFVMVFVQSSAEELLCRGFMYQMLLKGSGRPVYAIVGNSMFFAVMHLFNKGVTLLSVFNIFLFGILFSFMVYYMDSLWCAFAAHAAWNFTQNILFGLPNSGIVVPYSVFKLDTASAVNSFAYHVGFGIEGTILADVVLLAVCAVMCLWGRKYGTKTLGVWRQAGEWSYVNNE